MTPVWASPLPSEVNAWNPLELSVETSTAISAWAMTVTALIALIAGIVALSQLCEARKARKLTQRLAYEEARPYVAVYMEPSKASQQIVDLVIKNLGKTAAEHVAVRITPLPMESAPSKGGSPSPVVFPKKIPYLVPGQEWRIFWDNGITRHNSGLPEGHVAIVTYTSKEKKFHSESFCLDWSIYNSRKWTNVLSIHDIAKRLLEISNTLKNFNLLSGRALRVHTWDGANEQSRTLAEHVEERKSMNRLLHKLGIKNIPKNDDDH
ncbi:hypothetical protein [Rhodococcus ruber]|uniref:hypothetical protein n=1 Tax=Rhodococcus ruber TaxID=1830 RepID=UPI0012698706|nr:hypothetical protein [Rhodococcus ruber]